MNSSVLNNEMIWTCDDSEEKYLKKLYFSTKIIFKKYNYWSGNKHTTQIQHQYFSKWKQTYLIRYLEGMNYFEGKHWCILKTDLIESLKKY